MCRSWKRRCQDGRFQEGESYGGHLHESECLQGKLPGLQNAYLLNFSARICLSVLLSSVVSGWSDRCCCYVDILSIFSHHHHRHLGESELYLHEMRSTGWMLHMPWLACLCKLDQACSTLEAACKEIVILSESLQLWSVQVGVNIVRTILGLRVKASIVCDIRLFWEHLWKFVWCLQGMDW